jgi:hypothetical protein
MRISWAIKENVSGKSFPMANGKSDEIAQLFMRNIIELEDVPTCFILHRVFGSAARKVKKKWTAFMPGECKNMVQIVVMVTFIVLTLWLTNITMENHHFQWVNPL